MVFWALNISTSLKLTVLTTTEEQTKWKQITVIRNHKTNYVKCHEFSALNILSTFATDAFGDVAGIIMPLSKLLSISLSDCCLSEIKLCENQHILDGAWCFTLLSFTNATFLTQKQI